MDPLRLWMDRNRVTLLVFSDASGNEPVASTSTEILSMPLLGEYRFPHCSELSALCIHYPKDMSQSYIILWRIFYMHTCFVHLFDWSLNLNIAWLYQLLTANHQPVSDTPVLNPVVIMLPISAVCTIFTLWHKSAYGISVSASWW